MLIKNEEVVVNGVVSESLTQEIDPKNDHVLVAGKHVGFTHKMKYYKFYKPKGILSTLEDPKGRPCIADYIKKLEPSLFPVGRLDRNTTGLILLTNDGPWANQILHPRYSVSKIYEVEIDKDISRNDCRRLEVGFFLEDGPVQIALLNLRSKKSLQISISEGRNRIIRRAFYFLGYEVRKLKRSSIGPVQLGKLKEGEVKPLTRGELTSILDSTKDLSDQT